MLKIYICEDNNEQREKMNTFVDELLAVGNMYMEKAVVTADPYEIIESVEKDSVGGVFFLDVDLNTDINGLELAKRIREIQPRCFIVFVTTHSEMAFMTFSYRVEAMDYIIKDNLEELKSRLHQCLIKANERSQEDDEKKKYLIKIGDNIRLVPYDEILYFEAVTDVRKIVLHTHDAVLEFTGKLKDVEQQMDERFYRCHRSIIVNRDYIKQIDKENRIIYLVNGESCPMSVRLGKGI